MKKSIQNASPCSLPCNNSLDNASQFKSKLWGCLIELKKFKIRVCFKCYFVFPLSSNLRQFICLLNHCVFFRMRIIALLDCFIRRPGSRLVCCWRHLENEKCGRDAAQSPSPRALCRAGWGTGLLWVSRFPGNRKIFKMLNPKTHGSEETLQTPEARLMVLVRTRAS